MGMLKLLKKSVLFDKDDNPGSQEGEPLLDGETQDNDGETKPVQMTQKDLNKLFADRAKQASKSKEKEILEALGIENIEAAQAIIKAAKDAEDANKSELEKAKSDLMTANKNFETLEQENLNLKRKMEFRGKVEELKLKFASSEAFDDAFNALDPEEENMEKAVKDLSEKRSYYFAQADEKTQPPPRDGREKGKVTQQATQEQVRQSKRRMISPL